MVQGIGEYFQLMESMARNESEVLTNSSFPWGNKNSSSFWSNKQYDSEERAILSNSSCFYSGKVASTEDIFIEIQKLRRSQTPKLMSTYPEKGEEPTSVIASTVNVGNSASGIRIGDANSAQELYSFPLINEPYANIFGVCTDRSQVINDLQNGAKDFGVPTGFHESLDCLMFSVTHSNTDTSIEDDGISMIFSDYRSLWNSTSQTASSGESENNTSNPGRNKDIHVQPVSELDISLDASDKCKNKGKSAQAKPVSTKRRNAAQSEINISYSEHPYFDLQNDCSYATEERLRLFSKDQQRQKKPRLDKQPSSSNINFQQHCSSSLSSCVEEPDPEAIQLMKEMIYRAAAFRPVDLGLEVVEKPKRRNVKISSDPQTVAARLRREKVSERIRVLQKLVPGGSKMDTASMLDEAANYLKFLRLQVKALENLGHKLDSVVMTSPPTNTITAFSSLPFNHQTFPMQRQYLSILQNPSHM